MAQEQSHEEELLGRASQEIKNLRKTVQTQTMRLNMFDDMMLILRTRPDGGGNSCVSEDLVYTIDKYLESKTNKDTTVG